ncbi:hypothetical protein EMCRGX_G024079 [Ephydatia muelleri]
MVIISHFLPIMAVSLLSIMAVNLLPIMAVSLLPIMAVSFLPIMAVNLLPIMAVSLLSIMAVNLLPIMAVSLLPIMAISLLPIMAVSLLPIMAVSLLPIMAVSLLPIMAVSLLPIMAVSLLPIMAVSLLPIMAVSLLPIMAVSLLPIMAVSLLPSWLSVSSPSWLSVSSPSWLSVSSYRGFSSNATICKRGGDVAIRHNRLLGHLAHLCAKAEEFRKRGVSAGSCCPGLKHGADDPRCGDLGHTGHLRLKALKYESKKIEKQIHTSQCHQTMVNTRHVSDYYSLVRDSHDGEETDSSSKVFAHLHSSNTLITVTMVTSYGEVHSEGSLRVFGSAIKVYRKTILKQMQEFLVQRVKGNKSGPNTAMQ